MTYFKLILLVSILHGATQGADYDLTSTTDTWLSSTGTILDTTSINCTFDYNRCGWKNDVYSTTIWLSNSGPTNSSRTGPTQDHTSGFGRYLYLEASGPRTIGDYATIKYTFLNPIEKGCLYLYYHMYGVGIGTLKVIGQDPDGYRRELWAKTLDQGDQWLPMMLPIQTRVSQFLITAVRGRTFQGDIAIDDVAFSYSSCQAKAMVNSQATRTVSTQQPTTTGHPANTASPSCNFDYGLCGWAQVHKGDDFDWSITSSNTPTFNTGPSSDHTSGYGRYLYIEASPPRRSNDLATIRYQLPKPIKQGCLSLYYHMDGSHIGALAVVAKDLYQIPTQLWSANGYQGKTWNNVKINITHWTSVLEISGVRGNGVQGDIAIDDVSFNPQPCSGTASKQEPQLVKRLEFEAVYHVDCSVLTNALAREMLLTSAKSHADSIRLICAGDCKVLIPLSPKLSCEKGRVVVRWPTGDTYQPNTVSLPDNLKQNLFGRIHTITENDFKIIVSTKIPPFVYPTKSQYGEPIRAVLKTECVDGSRYDEASNSCSN